MDKPTNRNQSPKRRIAALAALVAIGMLAVGVPRSAADHGLPHVDVLGRGDFTDAVAAQIRAKLDGQRTHAINVSDASDLMVVEITLHDGAVGPWHTHTGPGLLVNTGPGTLTTLIGDDCVLREYGPGEAFVDLGQGKLHAAFNSSGQDLVVYAAFLGIEGPFAIPAEPPPDCDVLP